MPAPVHDRLVQFRAAGPILDAAREHAAAAGMTITEVLRATLRAAARGNLINTEK